jgi:hypothetical protein
MKKINPHFVYLPLLCAALGLCFWFNQKLNVTNRRMLEMNRTIRNNNEIIETSNAVISDRIREILHGDTTKNKIDVKADSLLEITQQFCDYVRETEAGLNSLAGGPDVKRTDGQPVERNCYRLSAQYFDAQKLTELENTYQVFCKNQIQTLGNQRYKEEIEKSLLLVDSSFWKDLPNLSVSSSITMLSVLRNIATIRATAFLNLYHKRADNGYCDDFYLPFAIAPTTNMVYEGERFKCGLGFCLTPCSFQKSGVKFFVNGKQVTHFEDGFPYYLSPSNEIGEKKLRLEMRIRNPLTGHEEIAKKDYTYHVLPKTCKEHQSK